MAAGGPCRTGSGRACWGCGGNESGVVVGGPAWRREGRGGSGSRAVGACSGHVRVLRARLRGACYRLKVKEREGAERASASEEAAE